MLQSKVLMGQRADLCLYAISIFGLLPILDYNLFVLDLAFAGSRKTRKAFAGCLQVMFSTWFVVRRALSNPEPR